MSEKCPRCHGTGALYVDHPGLNYRSYQDCPGCRVAEIARQVQADRRRRVQAKVASDMHRAWTMPTDQPGEAGE